MSARQNRYDPVAIARRHLQQGRRVDPVFARWLDAVAPGWRESKRAQERWTRVMRYVDFINRLQRLPQLRSGDPEETRELRTLAWLRKCYAVGTLPADIVAYCNAAASHRWF